MPSFLPTAQAYAVRGGQGHLQVRFQPRRRRIRLTLKVTRLGVGVKYRCTV
jgi:hypothetical protein